MPLKFTIFETEMGWMGIAGTAKGICRIILPMPDKASAFIYMTGSDDYRFKCNAISNAHELAKLMLGDSKSLEEGQPDWMISVKKTLIKYFKGQHVDFAFPLDLKDYTNFQNDVWEVTKSIPYGKLRTYGWIASQIGKPKSARAVGNALGANPLPIIIPCHRVVGSDGSLHGFSSGLHWKQRLIDLEKK